MRIDLRAGSSGGLSLPPLHLISDPEIVAVLKAYEAERRPETMDLVSARRLAELREAFDGDGVAEWVAQLETVREQRRVAWQEAIDHLLVAHTGLAGTEALITFTRRGSYFAPSPLDLTSSPGAMSASRRLSPFYVGMASR
jgi:hypothetical protein